MIIEQKLNHGGSRRSDRRGRPPAAPPINLTATWDLEPNAPRWSPDSRYRLFHRGERRHDAPVPRRRARGRAGRAGHQGRAAPQQRHVRQGDDDASPTRVGTYDSPSEVWTAEHRRHRRAAADQRRSPTSAPRSASRKTERLTWKSNDGTRDRRLADAAVRLRPREGSVSAGRLQPRRPALGGRLRLQLQAAVFRGQRLLRARHQLPQLDRLRRCVQVGDVGRVGHEGRPGRRVGHRLRDGALPDRSRKRVGDDGPFVRRLHDQLADHAVSRSLRRRGISGAGISNWISDYGTADIYRTKETEFFGAPWEDEAHRADDHAVAADAGRQRADADAVHQRRDGSARAVRRRRADVLRAAAARACRRR